MIRKIHKLGILALVADVFILMGLAYLFYYDIFVLSTTGPAPLRNVNADGVSLFIGTAIFTFEGIGLVLPIADSMREPGEFPRVLSWTMLFITVVFISAGALSYAAFGDAVETVVLLNLPPKDPLVHAIQLLYSLAIMFSVPLMLYPAVRIMEAAAWVRTGKASAAVKWQKNAFRAGLCILAALIS
ncbi:MAG: transmembrane amino acid transporter protein-domain-containing protein, partial [Olpidium bornovanus]